MKIYEDFNNIIEEYITDKLSGKYGKLPIAYHSEYYYSQDAIADFTIIFVTGQIQQKITQRPIQILCEVEEMYCLDVLEALDLTAQELNEQIKTLDGKEYRVFFNTPTITEKFVDYGATRRTIITCDASVILFDNVLKLDKIKVDDEEIAFVSTNIAYSADTSSTGSLKNSKINSVVTSCSNVLTIVYVPKKTTLTSTLLDIMLGLNNPNRDIKVEIEVNGILYKYLAICKDINYSNEFNTFPTLSMNLLRKGDYNG